MMRRKKTEAEVPSAPEAARAEFDRLRARVGERRREERALGRELNAVEAGERAAREALTRVLTQDGDSTEAEERLAKAKVAVARPWTEMIQAARLKITHAEGDVSTFALEHKEDLWAEYRPRAIAGAEKVDELLAQAVVAIKALDALEGQAYDILRAQGDYSGRRVPPRSLESLYNDLRRRRPTVPPIPTEETPRVFESEDSARASWTFGEMGVVG